MTLIVEQLRSLSKPERFAALESVIVAEFKAALLMTEDDELPLTDSFFDLGLTSLGLTDVKQRIEDLLGRGIGSTMLFNSPTVEQLMDRLTTDILAELFEASLR
jgi:acyl carrier protein